MSKPKPISIRAHVEPQMQPLIAGETVVNTATYANSVAVIELRKGAADLYHELRKMENAGDAEGIKRAKKKIADHKAEVAALEEKSFEMRSQCESAPDEKFRREHKAHGDDGFLWSHDDEPWSESLLTEYHEINDEKLSANLKAFERIRDKARTPLSKDKRLEIRMKLAKPVAEHDLAHRAMDVRRPGAMKALTVLGPERLAGHGPVKSFADPMAVIAYFFPEKMDAYLKEHFDAAAVRTPDDLLMTRDEQLAKLRELKEERLVLEHRLESIIRSAAKAGVRLRRPAMDLQSRFGFRWKRGRLSQNDLDPADRFSTAD
jgi:hypothetical protein